MIMCITDRGMPRLRDVWHTPESRAGTPNRIYFDVAATTCSFNAARYLKSHGHWAVSPVSFD